MSPEQFRILAHHFRLKPQAKFQPYLRCLFHNLLQSAGQLLLIYKPVPKAGTIIIPFPKPAIVQHQHLYAQFLCLMCQRYDFIPMERKISCFPVIDQNRSSSAKILWITDIFADNAMIIPAQPIQPPAAVAQDYFRCPKLLPGIQFPVKCLIVDAQDNSGASGLIQLHFRFMIAGIHQHKPITISRTFCCLRCAENHKRIVMMAAHPPFRTHRKDAMGNFQSFPLTLHAVPSMKVYQIRLLIWKIHAHGCRLI